jgi:PAS domain S-box-containing protein
MPLFLRKLNCVLAGVVRTSAEQITTEWVVPRTVRESPQYTDAVDRLVNGRQSGLPDEVSVLSTDHGVYYGFPLEGFGLLILAREKPFDTFFLKEFAFLCNMLARACLACTEVERRVAAELAAQRMQETVVHLRTLFEQAAVGVARIDMATGRFVQVNQRLCKILGYSRHEIEQMDERTLTHPKDPPVDQADPEKSEFTMEKRYIRKDGTCVWVALTVSTLWLAGTRSGYHIAIVQDITERKRAEEGLRTSEQKLASIVQGSPIPTFIIGRDHRLIHWNRAIEQLSGISAAEVIGTKDHWRAFYKAQRPCMADLLVDEDFERIAQWYPQGFQKSELIDEAYEGSGRFTGRNGLPIWLHFTAAVIRDSKGRVIGAVETLQDITDRKQAEEELKESISLLEATLEATADAIFVVDGMGKVKNFNTKFQKLWRLPSEILDTRDDDQALAAATPLLVDPNAFVAQVRELYNQRDREGNGTLHFKDGRVVEFYSKPQFLGDQITGRVWSFRDVTETHCAQQKQERLLRQVAAINKELSHFAYVVSHDLKAPLRGIKMLSEWLCADYAEKLDDEARESLHLLQSRVKRMHDLIEGILQYSRVGRIKEDVVEVDLDALLPTIVDAIAPPKHITVRMDGRLPVIECERTRITQVFQNLLTNAVKYSDKSAGEIVVACTEDSDAWTFSVADNGPGIEEKHFDKIFQIFQTLAPRDEFESTGVGLTLVKKIVEYYGGKVWLVSEVGKGTTFFFTLPKRSREDGNVLAGNSSEADGEYSYESLSQARD